MELTKNQYENMVRDEIKQKREAFMLGVARDLLKEKGFKGLSLMRLAELSGYSKQTVYNYFPTREDLVMSLVIQSTTQRLEYYQRAMTFDGRPREKLLGVHIVDMNCLSRDIRNELLLYLGWVRLEASSGRLNDLWRYEEAITDILTGIIHQAVELGDLELPYRMTENQLAFALRSLSIGGHAMAEYDPPSDSPIFEAPAWTHNKMGLIFLDGLGWRPLSRDWDYKASLKRIYREIFPEWPAKTGDEPSDPD